MKDNIYKFIIENIPFPIWIKDLDDTFIYVNQYFSNIFNKSTNYFIGKNSAEIFTSSSIKCEEELLSLIKSHNDEVLIKKVKENCYKQFYVTPYYDDNKSLLGTFGIIFDIENNYEKQKELEYQKSILRTIIDTLPEFIFYKDKDCKYLGYNKKWSDFYSKKGFDTMIGKTDLEIGIPTNLALSFIEKDKEVMEKRETQYIERTFIDENGELKMEESIKVPVINENDEILGLVGLARDVTKSKQIEKKLKYLSYTDVLTELNNRTYFEIKSKELNESTYLPIGVIMGDVNGLKLVNDTFGHLEGDRLLKEISKLLLKVVGNLGHVFRWGGDEFVILIPNCDKTCCEKMISAILNKCKNNDFDLIQLSISLGSSVKKTLNEDIYSCLKEAEEQLYRRKLLQEKSVRSSIVFSLQQSLEERNMETEKHTERLIKYALLIGKRLGLNMAELDELELVTKLHDIGKIGISEDILLKPGKLTDDEFEIMKTHTEKAYRILQSSSELSHIAKGVLTHHERWDGKGYPLGLKGKEIPLYARIVNVVDSFDAMTHNRVYNKAKSIDEAILEIDRCKGSQFDPAIADIFLSIIKQELDSWQANISSSHLATSKSPAFADS